MISRDAKSPPACAAKGKRSFFSERRTAPSISKRIAQTDLGTVAESWQKLCLASGGDTTTGDPCVQLAGINGINALLANADPCAQQDNADAMVDFAKSKGVKNKAALIANAVAYIQHPRNALNINGVTPSTPFCQKAPKNAELNGLVHKQLNGVDPGLFGSPALGIFAFGDRTYSRHLLRRVYLLRCILQLVLAPLARNPMSALARAIRPTRCRESD